MSNASTPFMFADDTSLLYTGKHIDELVEKINSELTKIDDWLRCNKLSINVNKTHYLVFCSKSTKVNDLIIKLNHHPISRVYSTKFLGVYLDANLSWKNHIEYISKKIAKSIGIICKARKILNKSTIISLYYTFVYPYYIYGIHVWGSTYPTSLKPIVLSQKKIIRIITCSKYMASTQILYERYKILQTEDVYKYSIAFLCINIKMTSCHIFMTTFI